MDPAVSNETQQQSLIQRLWTRRLRFAAVFCAVLALAVVVLMVVPVRYLATASVIVAEQDFGNSGTSAAAAQKIGDPADLESQLLVIRSPRVLRLAMTAPGVLDAAYDDCRSGSGASVCERIKADSAAFIDYVQSRYAVGAVGRSRVINISYQSSNPEVAQTMVNALTNAFLEDQRSAGSSSREVAASWLRKELAQLDTQLRDADARIQAFRSTKGLARGATAPISSERLTSISQQLSLAEAARAEAAARLQEIKANQSRGASDAPSVLSSRAVADLKQQLTLVSAQLASQSNVLGPRHPSLRALERERDLVQQRLTAEIASIAASAQKAFDANDAQVTALRKQVESVKAEVGSAATDEASIESMVRDAEIKRQQYSELYKRTSELETQRRVLLGTTRLVSLAELPSKPYFPRKIPFLAAGSTIGLMLALASVLFGDLLRPATAWMPALSKRTPQPRKAAVAPAVVAPAPAVAPAVVPPKPASTTVAPAVPLSPAASLAVSPSPAAPPVAASPPVVTPPAAVPPVAAPKVESATELSVVTGASILARMPAITSDVQESPIGAILAGRSGASLLRSLSLAQQDTAYQAALRDLSAGLLLDTVPAPCRKILVTAPGAGEGKTFLTLALAQNLAMAGRRVLAVECDLRTPRFEAALALPGGRGLQAVLLGEVQPADVVVRTSMPNLDVIAAGPASTQFDLLRRQQMSDLLLWSQRYDVVLVDGPIPAVLMDVGVLARQVDGVLLSMRAGGFSIGEAVATTSAIKAAGGKVLGIAMIMAKPDAKPDTKADAAAHPTAPVADAALRAT